MSIKVSLQLLRIEKSRPELRDRSRLLLIHDPCQAREALGAQK
jgi:hypothetical protein